MLCYKFNLFIMLLLISASSIGSDEKFTSEQCLKAQLETNIIHSGKLFGLIKSDLKISKGECIIKVTYKNILETKWIVDVCREPIHVKVTSKGSQDVYKRVKECDAGNPTDFCTHWNELSNVLQDHGLIFASGERENITTSHGKTYCTYLLLKKHLGKGILFSKYDVPGSIFEDDLVSDESCDLPESKKLVPVNSNMSTKNNFVQSDQNSSVDKVEAIEQTADKLVEEAKF